MNDWFSKIQGKVFNQVQYMLKKTYPSLKCTTKNESETPAEFPTLYLHELQPLEVGQDVTNESVNAIRCTIEIQVWTNTTEADCRKIISSAVDEMKRFRFNISAMPIVQTTDKISWGVIRCTRIIGDGDDIAT